jgi:fatty-acid desaturase
MSASLVQRHPWLFGQPSIGFRSDPHFYTKYDLVWLVGLVGSAVAMRAAGWEGLVTEWSLALVPMFLAAAYVQVMAGVFVHNCSHVNFPKPINRFVGELCGMIVGTRFASWEILHRQHHKYSDDVVKDPHPLLPGFWRYFVLIMLLNLEKNLRLQYLERWGDTPKNRRLDTFRTLFSFVTGLALMGFWFVLMGPIGFFFVFFPALVVGAIHVSHFNWSTHGGGLRTEGFEPINRDDGFYWFGNRIWFGIYFHANHHTNAGLFNPMKLPEVEARRAALRAARAPAGEAAPVGEGVVASVAAPD